MSRPSPADLTWPDGWATPKPLRWTAALSFLGLVGLAGLYSGVVDVITGYVAQGALLLWGGLMCLLGIAQGALTRVLVRRGATSAVHASTLPESGEKAVVIPYSDILFRLIFALPAMLLGAAGAVAVWAASAAVETQDAGYGVLAVAGTIAAGYLLASLAQFRSGKITRGHLALSPTGVYHRSWALSSFVPWRDVVAVWAFEGGGPVITVQATPDADGWSRRTSRFWKQPESDFGIDVTVRAMYLSVDPALAYHALQFYLDTPDARSELAGDDGVARLRRGRILTPS